MCCCVRFVQMGGGRHTARSRIQSHCGPQWRVQGDEPRRFQGKISGPVLLPTRFVSPSSNCAPKCMSQGFTLFCHPLETVLYMHWYYFLHVLLPSTFVCPTEIISFSDKASEFHDVNCEVVGVSVDSHFTHLAWINTPRKAILFSPHRMNRVTRTVVDIYRYLCSYLVNSTSCSGWRSRSYPHSPARRPEQTDLPWLWGAAGGAWHCTQVSLQRINFGIKCY